MYYIIVVGLGRRPFYKRTGKFKSLFTKTNGTVSLSNGKTATETSDTIFLVSGMVKDPRNYTFLDP